MIAQGKGHIVTIASLAGMNGMNRLVDYCASKFAAVGFDESLRAELLVDGHTGIETTVVCPYFVRTPLFDGIKSKYCINQSIVKYQKIPASACLAVNYEEDNLLLF